MKNTHCISFRDILRGASEKRKAVYDNTPALVGEERSLHHDVSSLRPLLVPLEDAIIRLKHVTVCPHQVDLSSSIQPARLSPRRKLPLTQVLAAVNPPVLTLYRIPSQLETLDRQCLANITHK